MTSSDWPEVRARGVLVAAPASNSGKTTITLGLLRALARAGHDVVSAKAGPDYIDPRFHAAATGADCINLDPWAMRPELIRSLHASHGSQRDLLLVEGMMGLFDGAADGSGSAADLAAMLGLPVVLVVDVAAQAHSVAALVRGFAGHRPDISIAGVILNRVGGPRHETMLRTALEPLGVPVIGAVNRDRRLDLPSRHLGLVQAQEHETLETFLETAADIVGGAVDLDALMSLTAGNGDAAAAGASTLPPLGQRMAIARDEAFAFAYPHHLSAWRAAGADLTFFSPLDNEAPSPGADAIFLPGGYPELHAGRLAGNAVFLDGLRSAASRGTCIYGECGGYMVLGAGLIDAAGDRHAMAGLLALETSFAERTLHLGYRHLKPVGDFPWSRPMSGHEFHYASTSEESGGEPLFEASDALGQDVGPAGLREGSVAGSFMHVIDLRNG